METLTPQRPRWFVASSSLKVEELACSSGLPRQASIAGCLSSADGPEEWRASLQRQGQEGSLIAELLSPIPAFVERSLLEELASTVLENVGIWRSGHPLTCTKCDFLTSSQSGQIYLVQVKRSDLAGREAGTRQERVSESCEPVVPDTDRAYTVHQMARAWRAIGKPITEDDVQLTVDPDDYPLF